MIQTYLEYRLRRPVVTVINDLNAYSSYCIGFTTESAEFSFLMSAPPIVGAALLEVVKALETNCLNCPSNESAWPLVIYGGIIAAIVGYFSLVLLHKAIKSDRFWMFGPYCLLAGVITLILI